MTRVLVPVLAAVIAAGAVFDLVDALGAFSGRAPDALYSLSEIAGLAAFVSTVYCVVLAVRRRHLPFAWMLAPACGAFLAAGYYVHTAPYCGTCRNSTTIPSAEPWVIAIAGSCLVASAVAARWPRIGMPVTALALLGTLVLGVVIGLSTIS